MFEEWKRLIDEQLTLDEFEDLMNIDDDEIDVSDVNFDEEI